MRLLGSGVLQCAAPHATGDVYVNFLTQEQIDRIPAAYRPEVWKRLAEVKTKWDPKNLFRMNQNISLRYENVRNT